MMNYSTGKYILLHPDSLQQYHPLISGEQLNLFRAGNRDAIQKFYIQEYRIAKAIYHQLGNPLFAIKYGSHACNIVHEITIYEISIANFASYMAELIIAAGVINPDVERLLEISEAHARKSPCSNDIRIKVLANVFLLKSISEKAQKKQDEAYLTLEQAETDPWISQKDVSLIMTPVYRQKMMMEQTIVSHQKLLARAAVLKYSNPLEYYRTLKRVFEFIVNSGEEAMSRSLMPELQVAFSAIQNQVPKITAISLLKNFGQANALFGNSELAIRQLDIAAREAQRYELKGQVVQINRLLQAVTDGNVVGKLSTFRV